MLQAPVNEEKLNASNSAITNALIDQYNDAAVKVFLNMIQCQMKSSGFTLLGVFYYVIFSGFTRKLC